MRVKRSVAGVTAVVVIGLLGAFFVAHLNNSVDAGASSTSSTTPSTSPSTIPITFSAFYLDVGGSSSLGFQPSGYPFPYRSRLTTDGYAEDLVKLESYKGVGLALNIVGCAGDTVVSMLSPVQTRHCYATPTTQMSHATKFLAANKLSPGLVSIDLGFNDVSNCLRPATVDEACVDQAIHDIQVDIPKIVQDLKASAGPHVRFVGLLYNDPFLANYLSGPAGPSDATATLVAMDRVDAALMVAYNEVGATVADVPTWFKSDDSTPVNLANVGQIPENVEMVCQLTWMCYGPPFGPDDHPNDAGYSFIAQAIESTLPSRW
jgi:lysophospholipase L1-like esterase